MKKEIPILPRPERFSDFYLACCGNMSWYDFVLGMPSLVFLVTGWKANGKENACLQSWASFVGTGPQDFICILSKVNRGGHMYQSLKETGCCVLNFPDNALYPRCVKTIGNNGFDTDEITAAGLTAEPAQHVNAPRVAECFLNIECELLWEHELAPGSGESTVALKAVHVCMDDARYDQAQLGRYGKTGYLFQVDQATNPEDGVTADFGPGVIVQGDPVPWITK